MPLGFGRGDGSGGGSNGAEVSFSRAVIVGTGLIGASLAAAARRAGCFAHSVGVGRKRSNLEDALRLGLVDSINTNLDEALRGADLVVLCTPVAASVSLLEQVAGSTPQDCLLTDVGSVKAPICRRARELGLASRFVAAHPMAGGTETGAGAADPELFVGATTVITPLKDNDAAAVEKVSALWRALGSQVLEMDAEAHDAAVALSSHLPQMVSSALAATALRDPSPDGFTRLVAGGFRDTTRLAAGDDDMWVSIARLNRDALLREMQRFERVWAEFRRAVAEEDEDALRELLRSAKDFRRGLR